VGDGTVGVTIKKGTHVRTGSPRRRLNLAALTLISSIAGRERRRFVVLDEGGVATDLLRR
jgi:hypothetical protein